VEDPQRNYPRALAWVVPLSMATYFLPTLASLAALGNWQEWHTGFFTSAAEAIGGHGLALLMTLAAMLTNLSILNSTVLASTRMPFALAQDGYLPVSLTRLHPRYGTPWIAIITSALIYALLARQTLTQLLTVYIWLRIATSLMTVLAAWRLRQARPELPRPFRIPWGRAGILYVVGAPILISAWAMIWSDEFSLRWGPVALGLGPIAYFVVRRAKPGTAT